MLKGWRSLVDSAVDNGWDGDPAGTDAELLTRDDFVAYADPHRLLPQLWCPWDGLAARVAAAYRAGSDFHRRTTSVTARAARIRIDQLRAGITPTVTVDDKGWRPRWVTGGGISDRLRAQFYQDGLVGDVTGFDLNGRPVGISVGFGAPSRLWDVRTGDLIHTLRHERTMSAIDHTEIAGRPVAVGSGHGVINLWDVESGSTRNTMPSVNRVVNKLTCATVDGEPVAVSGGGDGHVEVWDLTTGLLRRRFVRKGFLHALTCTTLMGRPVAVVGVDYTLRIYDLQSGAEIIAVSQLADRPHSIACTTVSGQDVAVVGFWSGKGMACDLAEGTPYMTFDSPHCSVSSVSCAEIAGRPVAVTGGTNGAMGIWDLRGREVIDEWPGHIGSMSVMCARLDGIPMAITGGTDRTVRVWDLSDSAGDTPPAPEVLALASVEHGGRGVAVTGHGDGALRVHGLDTGHVTNTVSAHQGAIRDLSVGQVEGKPVLVSGGPGLIRSWDVTTWDPIGSVDVSVWDRTVGAVDGRALAICGQEDDVLVLAASNEEVYTLPGVERATVKPVSVAGRTLLVISDIQYQGLRLWEASSGHYRGAIADFGGALCSAASFHHDEGWVLLTGDREGLLQMWSLDNGECLRTIIGHDEFIDSIAVHGPSATAASASLDRTICVWDLRSWRQRHRIDLPSPAQVSFAADGTLLAAYGNNVTAFDATGADMAPDRVELSTGSRLQHGFSVSPLDSKLEAAARGP